MTAQLLHLRQLAAITIVIVLNTTINDHNIKIVAEKVAIYDT